MKDTSMEDVPGMMEPRLLIPTSRGPEIFGRCKLVKFKSKFNTGFITNELIKK